MLIFVFGESKVVMSVIRDSLFFLFVNPYERFPLYDPLQEQPLKNVAPSPR